ncbi:hypothetical protein F383_37417 [Gossypium arboreum]|uniref:Uncharacterized protein n=1 Tax=Gossypium arboreum TaxID=29729 RepID=A0A0B0MES0_GOSAR|nr:hypothetical protein F383_37417 [Gossypium arboreum]
MACIGVVVNMAYMFDICFG